MIIRHISFLTFGTVYFPYSYSNLALRCSSILDWSKILTVKRSSICLLLFIIIKGTRRGGSWVARAHPHTRAAQARAYTHIHQHPPLSLFFFFSRHHVFVYVVMYIYFWWRYYNRRSSCWLGAQVGEWTPCRLCQIACRNQTSPAFELHRFWLVFTLLRSFPSQVLDDKPQRDRERKTIAEQILLLRLLRTAEHCFHLWGFLHYVRASCLCSAQYCLPSGLKDSCQEDAPVFRLGKRKRVVWIFILFSFDFQTHNIPDVACLVFGVWTGEEFPFFPIRSFPRH